jgi:CheY-like chemotaxis protein
VTLRVTLQREGYPQHHVAFDVIDTGIGMTDEQLASLFEPFAQGDGSRARRHGGMGLGLALANRLAKRLRGEITVVSSTAEGSAFRLVLPIEPRGNGARPSAPEDSLVEVDSGPVDCRVLVAEDGADNRKLIDLILRQAGGEVTLADDGREAVELAMEAWRADEPFDVILMDMQMPVTDGICATQALRLQSYPGVIIALTADARAANREECLKAGCDEFLSKPIDRELLLATIRALLKPAG